MFIQDMEWLLRVVVAALCGMAIGYERAIQRKSAGIRTHIVVATAAALFMIISKYGFYDILRTQGVDLDPSRVAAQIVSGISFLGAGAILVRKEQISGLTTAAGIWATAAIGTAIGAGMYFVGVSLTLFIVLIQFVFHDDTLLNKFILQVHVHMQIEAENRPDIQQIITQCLEQNDVNSINMRIISITKDVIAIQIDGVTRNNYNQNEVMIGMEKTAGIISVKTISNSK
ncbi:MULTISPECIES: MgtC/SapB family protein [Amylolactobacillus]|nr:MULTISPECIES: MgtC/SapB family protein [Amylolactobacillus]APT19307.1 methyltransferase [Amylolactobacillus amylophilus DSM 20533 = JCM 1125]GED80497.1 methyltransferase [Amylolactobacillus amylophilus]